MNNYCSKCNNFDCNYKTYNMDCTINYSSECDKYKEESDSLYVRAKCIQEESNKMLCEAKSLEEEAREMERRAKELYARSKIAYSDACKLESESNCMLELADFYCHKAHECYKNTSKACKEKNYCKEDNKCGSNSSMFCNKGIVTNTTCRCTTPKYDGCCD